jgi:hypothetical protein
MKPSRVPMCSEWGVAVMNTWFSPPTLSVVGTVCPSFTAASTVAALYLRATGNTQSQAKPCTQSIIPDTQTPAACNVQLEVGDDLVDGVVLSQQEPDHALPRAKVAWRGAWETHRGGHKRT